MGNERWYRWYGASQAIASMLLLNGYWLLFNLPVLLLALGLIFPSSPRQFLFSLVGLIISFPSILLPATFALFGVMRRWLYYQEPRQAIGGTFWRLYRENYRRSVAAGLFFGSLALLLLGSYRQIDSFQLPLLAVGYLFLSSILLVWLLYFICDSVHLAAPMRLALIKSFFIIFWAPLQTLMLLGLLSGLALLLVLIHPLLAGLILGVLGSQCACYSYLRIVQKAQAKAAPADE
ncbi:hypothetical protein YS9_0099 [Enterococcus sp. C1]|uniref:DUF624 domain-containing protein n=1 Tax=unclassified Enterococcus TaxID=2608891 RepID=UPI000271F053|nr:DUF624 domain-containing protein [Enterococcus sp. C1]EJF51105.1 hypothetical protein YS9_0099 [Enterococcus sp. C1]